MSIRLDPRLKNIAVRLSGGPDSSIIYYAVCDFYKQMPGISIYPYTISTPLRPHSGKKAKKVVEIVANLTGVSPIEHYVSWHDAHNPRNSSDLNSIEYTKAQDDLCKHIISSRQIDIHYSGLSINCPVAELEASIRQHNLPPESYASLDTRDRTRDVPSELELSIDGKVTMCLPFASHDKRQVKKQFDHYGVVDVLFPHTWSCEHNGQMHVEEPEHCGKCYFCIERIYAFGRL